MRNQLSKFEGIIDQLFILPHENLRTVNIEQTNFLKEIEAERGKLRNTLDDLMFSAQPEDFLRRILRIYHVRLTTLSNKVYNQFKLNKSVSAGTDKNDVAISNIYIRIVFYIDELIQYGILVSAEYHDPELTIPDYNFDIDGDCLKVKYDGLIGIIKKKRIHRHLADIFQEYFGSLNSDNGDTCTYRQLEYANRLLQKINFILKQEESGDCMEEIWEMVVNLNFNTERIRQFSATWIYLNAIEDKIEETRIQELEEVLFRLRAMDENLVWCYDREYPSVKDCTERLLTDEIHSLETQQHRILTELSTKEGNYFVIDLTVKQLILWAQITVLLKRIPHHTPVHVFRILTIFVRTMNHGAISFKTARKKVGEFDGTTVKGLHRYFTEVIDVLQTKYGHLL